MATTEGVLEQEDFANPGSGWPILSEGTYYFGYHPPDYYHIEVGQANGHTVVTRPPDFDNVTVETEVLVDHTNTETGIYRYGLALRRTGDNYYAFVIYSRTGTWQVLKSSGSGLELLKEGQVYTLRGFAPKGYIPDKTDSLKIDAAGPDFTFHINGQPVAQVSDSDYASGEAGFFVETLDETLAHVHFDSLTVLAADGSQAIMPTTPADPNLLLEESFTDSNSGWPVTKDDKYII